MSQALQLLLIRYDHLLTNVPLGIQIKAKAPESTSQLAGYITASVLGGFGLFLAFIGLTRIGFGVLIFGLVVAANVWKRGQGTNIRKVLSILIGAEDVTLSQGFKTERIPRNEVADISVRMRTSDGQKEAQLYFTDASGRQYESLLFYGISRSGLEESANRIADHIWNYVVTEDESRKELGHLDLPTNTEKEERPPWG